jgi:hypothetical protein
MLAFIERSDGLLFATTYVFMNSAAYAENVGTSLVMRDGVISPGPKLALEFLGACLGRDGRALPDSLDPAVLPLRVVAAWPDEITPKHERFTRRAAEFRIDDGPLRPEHGVQATLPERRFSI